MTRLVELNETIVVTGAGGWLARELFEILLVENGPDWIQSNVVALSSGTSNLILSDGTNLSTENFWGWEPKKHHDGFVQLAFLTKEKSQALSTEDYISQNIGLMSRHAELMREMRPDWGALVSSGAVFVRGTEELPALVTSDPYGYLKWLEELSFKEVALAARARFSIGRLWAGLGSYMKANPAYALVDFVSQAVAKGRIDVRSPHPVYRNICDVASFMKELVMAARMGLDDVFDSSGEVIEIEDLARLISALPSLGNPGVHRHIVEKLDDDRYLPLNIVRPEIVEELSVSKRPMQQLVADACETIIIQAPSIED